MVRKGVTIVASMSEPTPPADKTALVVKVIFEQGPLCAGCISTKSGLAVSDIEPAARLFESTITLKRDMARCKACERWTLVYSLFGVQRRT